MRTYQNQYIALPARLLAGLFRLCLLAPAVSLAGPAPTDLECEAALSATVTELQALNFGSMLPGTAGTVTVTYKGAISTTGPTLLTSSFQNAILVFSTGVLDCSANTPTVTLTPGQLDKIGGYSGTATPLTLQNLVYSTKTGNPFSKFNAGYFYIGGDLIVPANPESGSYTGTYGVTLQFP